MRIWASTYLMLGIENLVVRNFKLLIIVANHDDNKSEHFHTDHLCGFHITKLLQ